jgi:uncharacterized protein (TIGR02757 family)
VNKQRIRLKEFLDDAYHRYARPGFIADDPIQVPHAFDRRADAETIGFLVATIAWGQRKTIIRNAWELVRLFDEQPHEFIMDASRQELDRLDRFVHRTFNGIDLRHFVLGLRHLYVTYGGIEEAFITGTDGRPDPADMSTMIARFRLRFFEPPHQARTGKHVADPMRGRNAKRINMYLRWMVRPNDHGVDLGLWKRIPPSALHLPLDVHTGRVGRALGLLHRPQDDWKAVVEITDALRLFDPDDPVKYDIALFGMGVEAKK